MGEARSGQRIEARAKQACTPDTAANTDGARACEIFRAATGQTDRILQEGRDLLTGLQLRLGSVPAWARVADGQLIAVAGRPRSATAALAPASAAASR